jgi:Uma2 family endonuclease
MNMLPPALLAEEEIELEKGFEWVDGQAVEKPMGAESSVVIVNLIGELKPHVSANKLGVLLIPDTGYQIGVGSSRHIRKPDLSFVALGRFPDERVPRGNVTIAPDLVVESISPNDTAENIEQRIADFMSVGVRLFWVIYPATRSVWVLRPDGSAARLIEGKDLSGEDVVPDFSCPVANLFSGI